MTARRPASAVPVDHRFTRGNHSWRVQSDARGCFDEIVVVKGKSPGKGREYGGLILHAAMMNDRECFVDVAGVCLWVHVGRDGKARITGAEDRRYPEPRDLLALVDRRDVR